MKEVAETETRIKELDRVIQNLYEDKVADKLFKERHFQISDNYETEQAELKEKVEKRKGSIDQARARWTTFQSLSLSRTDTATLRN